MSRYAFLILPSFNRVYAEAATGLAKAELEVFNRSVLAGRVSGIDDSDIAGVAYVTFDCDALDVRDAAFLANLSSLYALFRVEGEDEALYPVPLHRLDRFDDDLITILKYPGKTNEQFTKLLLNVTMLSSRFASDMLTRRLSVLDPLCGRGTTLNQALMYGFNAYGVDIDKRDIETYSSFIQRWLKDKRLKHQADFGPVRRNRQVVASRLRVSFAATKDEYKAGDLQQLDVVHAETGKRLARSPLDLLSEGAPIWAKALRPGGALGISWNTFVARRDDAAATLAAAGLQVMDNGPYLNFRHRVDQAIVRDILIARKP